MQGLRIDPDAEVLRLQDILLNGLEERLIGVQIKSIQLKDACHVIVIRVPQSLNGPHRVKTNQHFFLREGPRKRQMNIPEVRNDFIKLHSNANRLKDFRIERISRILAGETPVPLFEGAIAVLHFLPFNAVNTDTTLFTTGNHRNLPVLSASYPSFHRLNIDGIFSARNVTENGCGAYTQLYRNGYIEAVRVFTTLLPERNFYNIASRAYEEEIIEFYQKLLPEFETMGASPPVVFFLSILKAKSATLGINLSERVYLDGDQGFFDRNTILIPDLLISDFTHPAEQVLKPAFDLVWNAAGITHSWNFDKNGNWKARPN